MVIALVLFGLLGVTIYMIGRAYPQADNFILFTVVLSVVDVATDMAFLELSVD